MVEHALNPIRQSFHEHCAAGMVYVVGRAVTRLCVPCTVRIFTVAMADALAKVPDAEVEITAGHTRRPRARGLFSPVSVGCRERPKCPVRSPSEHTSPLLVTETQFMAIIQHYRLHLQNYPC